jgi:squalene-associated FAD-dependent desaturase
VSEPTTRGVHKTVAIIGGGVAGIAAALPLADAGLRVQIFEKRALLGGRASSFLDHKTGERIDECQHGTMRCCTNLTDLLTRLGVNDQIRYFDTLEFLDGDGKRASIRGSGMPAPFHTSLSFLTFRSLGLRDKIAIGRGMLAILRSQPAPQWEALDIATWFQRMGQTERAIRRFWRPTLVSACNAELDRISCTHAFKLFRDGFLVNALAYQFGVPRVPLGTLYTEPTLAYLERRGGCVRTHTIVDEIHFTKEPEHQIAALTLQTGETVKADYYISALQFDLLRKLLPSKVTGGVSYWEDMDRIELSPILGVNLWFDRPVDCPPALALLDRATEWVFNKNLNYDLPSGQNAHLSMVISASHRYTTMSKDEVLQLVLDDVRACVPDARQANVVKSYVVRWPKATISPQPGVEALRPDQRSPISNLYVAGEWTRTGWPSTMESAARSGYRVAEYILEREGLPHSILAPDLPVSGLARLLMFPGP